MTWLNKILEQLLQFIKNVLLVPVDIVRNLISNTKLKATGVKYLAWGLLYMGKPFTCVGNWFWKLHRTVLDWNK
jgi:hypothetical protein